MMDIRHELISMQRKDYLRQAEQHRLLCIATADHRSAAGKIMAWTGRRLVALGEGLQLRASVTAPVVFYTEPCR